MQMSSNPSCPSPLLLSEFSRMHQEQLFSDWKGFTSPEMLITHVEDTIRTEHLRKAKM